MSHEWICPICGKTFIIRDEKSQREPRYIQLDPILKQVSLVEMNPTEHTINEEEKVIGKGKKVEWIRNPKLGQVIENWKIEEIW